MNAVEICLIIFAVIVVCSVLGSYIYKRIHKIPTGCSQECGCHSSKDLVKEYNKMYHPKNKKCCHKMGNSKK